MSSPAITLRDGVLSVTIWRNTSDKGTYYTLNPARSYRQGDETWKQSDSLSQDDALAMAELLREAYNWIKAARKADSKSRKDAAA